MGHLQTRSRSYPTFVYFLQPDDEGVYTFIEPKYLGTTTKTWRQVFDDGFREDMLFEEVHQCCDPYVKYMLSLKGGNVTWYKQVNNAVKKMLCHTEVSEALRFHQFWDRSAHESEILMNLVEKVADEVAKQLVLEGKHDPRPMLRVGHYRNNISVIKYMRENYPTTGECLLTDLALAETLMPSTIRMYFNDLLGK